MAYLLTLREAAPNTLRRDSRIHQTCVGGKWNETTLCKQMLSGGNTPLTWTQYGREMRAKPLCVNKWRGRHPRNACTGQGAALRAGQRRLKNQSGLIWKRFMRAHQRGCAECWVQGVLCSKFGAAPAGRLRLSRFRGPPPMATNPIWPRKDNPRPRERKASKGRWYSSAADCITLTPHQIN